MDSTLVNSSFDFLNQNSGAFSILFSGIVAISTIVYAALTWKLVSETRKMRKTQTEPKISISIQSREEWINIVDMVIKNIGLGPAYNISFSFDEEMSDFINKPLSNMKLFQNGINYFPPGQKLQFPVADLADHFDEKIKKKNKIEVYYQNNIGGKYQEDFIIDFSELDGILQFGEPPLYKLANNIEKIQKDIHHFSTGFKKLKTIVYTAKEIEEINKRLIEKSKKNK